MIIISNRSADINLLLSEYPEGSIERDIIRKMVSTNTRYSYSSLNQLRFELKFRKEIVNASVQLSRSRMGFEVFRKSRCNERYWKRTYEGGFLLKDNVRPSDAINDIYINSSEYGTECATAMVIVYYKALLDTYPEQLFNKLFPDIHLMNWHYIDPLLKEVGYMIEADDYFPGDRRYFANPDVDPETPYLQGQNVIDLSEGLYYGHGMGITNGATVIRLLNNNRIEGATKSAYLLSSVGRPDFKKLAAVYEQYI